jgi:hypothetical protein
LKRLLYEPLLHFLLAGGILFGVYRLVHRNEPDLSAGRTIVVDKESLLNFLQYRSKAFKPEYFSEQLNSMSDKERQDLISQFIEEEALYREAKALGLEQGDDVIRQRLIQKMRYLMDDLSDNSSPPSDAVLLSYLDKNRNEYAIAPSVTFTHVFTDSAVHGDKAAKDMAEQLKVRLNAEHATFNDAPKFGERFPFMQNYVERTFDFIESNFGDEFAVEIRKIPLSSSQWAGPIRSTYGYHLVLLTARTESRVPALQEIRTQVLEDWMRDRTDSDRARSIQHLLDQYTIELKGLGKPSEAIRQ